MQKLPGKLTLEGQLEECKAYIVRRSGGEELYQLVCLRCVEQAAGREWQNKQYGFIWRVVRQVSIDMYRRATARERAWDQAEKEKSTVDEPPDILERLERDTLLRDCLGRLDEPYREMLTGRYIRGETPEKLANASRAPVNTIKTRLRRGLEKLRGDPTL